MDPTQLIILAFLGLFGGVLAGLVGVGGGIVFVPALIYVAGWDITDAVAASLVIIIFSSISGTLRNLRSENSVDWRTTALLSSTVAPSALIGVAIGRVAPEVVVELVFATLLIALAYPTAKGRGDLDGTRRRLHPALVLVAGVGIGALSGLVGVGGGVLMVPLMVIGLGLRTKVAIATSLAVVLFVGIVGAAGYFATGFDRFAELLPLVVGCIVGAWLGVKLRDLLPDVYLRVGFAFFMVVTSLRLFVDATNII